jgi:hypothetical protein
MLKINIDQKGFAAIETALTILIIAVIGGTGYYVYHANKKTNDTLNTSSQVAQSSPGKTKNKTNAKFSTYPQSQKYLAIKEWGVRMPINNTVLAASSYKHFTQKPINPGDVSNWVEISAPYTANVTLNCNGAAQKGSSQTIARFANHNDAKNYTVLEDKGVKKIGNYYYAFSKKAGFGDCDISASDTAKINTYQAALLSSFYKMTQ